MKSFCLTKTVYNYYIIHRLICFQTFRIFCSNLHYNENANRSQSKTADGTLKWSVVFPKANKGEKAIAKPLKAKPTYGIITYSIAEMIS